MTAPLNPAGESFIDLIFVPPLNLLPAAFLGKHLIFELRALILSGCKKYHKIFDSSGDKLSSLLVSVELAAEEN